MKRRFLAFALFVGAIAGFGSGFAHLKHAHRAEACDHRGGWQAERQVPIPDHIHDAEGRVYVRPSTAAPPASAKR